MINYSVLYIEDDEEILENVTFLLKRYVSKVFTAKDGEEALATYFEKKPDIIVSDINIPKLDGLSLVAKIREDDSEIPIIMMTAYKDSKRLLKAIDVGVSSYVTKPFTLSDLTEAIEKAISTKTLKDNAVKDSLTKLYNRCAFDEMVQHNIDIARRYDTYITYLMIDIDHFKEYNDTYGHMSGDDTLCKVAKCLQSHTKREDDHAFRIGGEEFTVIAIGLNVEKSLEYANLIRKDILALEIEHSKNSAHQFLSISLGVYVAKGDEINTKEQMYSSSDKALYISKNNGRNQVTLSKKDN